MSGDLCSLSSPKRPKGKGGRQTKNFFFGEVVLPSQEMYGVQSDVIK